MTCRLFGAKSLSAPMLGYCQLDPWEQTSVIFFLSKYKNFHSWNCIWKYRLRNGSHFVQVEMSEWAFQTLHVGIVHNGTPGMILKPRSHCADHPLPMFTIIADRPDLSWSWQNHQIVGLTPDLCLPKTASTILVRQLYDTGTTEVFDPLLVRFPRPLVRPLIRSTRLHSRCWRLHPRSCRFATAIKTT